MANPFDSIPTRLNGQRILAAWFETLKTAGKNLGTQSPLWEKFTFSHTALQTAGLTNDIELFSLLSLGTIQAIVVKHSTAFAGTGITAYTLSVGIVGSLDKYTIPLDVFQAVGATVFTVSSGTDLENVGSATSIRLSAIAIGANLDQSTAGSVDVYVLKSTLPLT